MTPTQRATTDTDPIEQQTEPVQEQIQAPKSVSIPAQVSRADQPPRTTWRTAGTASDSNVRLRDGLRFGFLVFAAVWVGWGVLGVLGIGLIQINPPVGVPGLDADPTTVGWHNFFTAGNRADALWYQRIAADGYRPDDAISAALASVPVPR